MPTVKVATIQTVEVGKERSPHIRPVAVSFPSRYIPLFGLLVASCSILGSVALNRYYGHDIGGIPWPYISDTAKDAPQAGLFSYGLTVTSCLIVWVVVINYGKICIDVDVTYPDPNDSTCSKRNFAALIAGLISAPNLGLLACFDTERSPELHLSFVLLFFLPCIVYLYMIKSVYELLYKRAQTLAKRSKDGKPSIAIPFKSYTSLETSLRYKRWISNIFLVAVTLYLPVGMYMVKDWSDYRNDVATHTFRAVAQHVSVFCLCCFFGSMVRFVLAFPF
mmetsp:Transcript_14324/g.48971  ORF Transcript_14324/g.48971 Transcript_14324/m.48971 type:complete len:278 (-) Transcript_14324:230-1063(-)